MKHIDVPKIESVGVLRKEEDEKHPEEHIEAATGCVL